MLAFFIAKRYLLTKHKSNFVKISTLFSMLGVVIGVAALIVVMSVMNGYRHELLKVTLGVDGHIKIYDYKERFDPLKLFPKIAENNLEDIDNIISLVNSEVMLMKQQNIAGANLIGIKLEDFKHKNFILNNIISGELDEFNDSGVVIGVDLANKLQLNIGDELKIISAKIVNTIVGTIPRFKTVRVAAIFQTGLFTYDNSNIYLNQQLSQQILSYGNQINYIEVNLKDFAKLEQVKQQLISKLPINYMVVDWLSGNQQLFTALEVERTAMFLILSLIVTVASFNIISGLYMLVNEKKRDIAILRSFGASKYLIIKIFLILGMVIGIIGTIGGLILGITIAQNIENIRLFLENVTATNLFDPMVYYLKYLPSKLDYADLYKISIMSFGLSVVAAIIPALKASSTTPIKIINYEK